MSKRPLASVLASHPVIGIIRGRSVEDRLAQSARLWDAGAAAVELTIEVEDAVPSLIAVVAAAQETQTERGRRSA